MDSVTFFDDLSKSTAHNLFVDVDFAVGFPQQTPPGLKVLRRYAGFRNVGLLFIWSNIFRIFTSRFLLQIVFYRGPISSLCKNTNTDILSN